MRPICRLILLLPGCNAAKTFIRKPRVAQGTPYDPFRRTMMDSPGPAKPPEKRKASSTDKEGQLLTQC